MTITVGTDTYISLNDAHTYNEEHGNSTWTDYRKVITAIVTNALGIQVTTESENNYSVDDRVSLYGTTNYNYIGNVKTIIDINNFVIDLTYVEDETSGYTSDEILEVCLRKATEWIDNNPKHKGNWKGSLSVSTQVLSFPRDGLVDEENRNLSDEDIPVVVENSCCEMAYKCLSEVIFPDISSDKKGLKRDKIDVIEKEWFASYSSSSLRKKYDYVDNLLSGLLRFTGNMIKMPRSY